ncbi:MAG: hypothetical protein HFE77_03260 [Clostridiales bacterium]|nr:hypothetical protein [Clostridiales bacterium]
MKDYSQFITYLSEHSSEFAYDILNDIHEVPEDKRHLSAEEWRLITEFVAHYQSSLLRQYHNWMKDAESD